MHGREGRRDAVGSAAGIKRMCDDYIWKSPVKSIDTLGRVCALVQGKPAHLNVLLTGLDEQGVLLKSHEGKSPTGRGDEWAVTSPRAPGVKGRCIVLPLPIPK